MLTSMPSVSRSPASREEVLAPSSPRAYRNWPTEDPTTVMQPTRYASTDDVELVRRCATATELDVECFAKNTRSFTTAGVVHYLLTHQFCNFNPVGRVRAEPRWSETIAHAVRAGSPVQIVYPLMCKQGCWVKSMSNRGPHAGEDCTFLWFGHLNRLVQRYYSPGCRFTILADARLYNSAFQLSEVEIDFYHAALHERVRFLGLDSNIEIRDYAHELMKWAGREYLERYDHYSRRIAAGDQSVTAGLNLDSLLASVKASIHTRHLGLAYADQRALFGPVDPAVKPSVLAREIENGRTTVAFREVLAIRLACRDIDLPGRVWPDAVRATCHKGPKQGHWVIGLRPYPEYYGSSKLLPYHGVPLVRRGRNDRPRLEIHPEVVLRGNPAFVRVLNSLESDDVYFYDAMSLPAGAEFDGSCRSDGTADQERA